MAKCSKCGAEVGCGCNLISGSCHTCYNLSLTGSSDVVSTNTLEYSTPKRVVYAQPLSAPPNTGFDQILNNNTLSKQEKIKRINDILEKGIQNALNQSQDTGS